MKNIITQFRPDYLFEISWEVCNKIGGVYTVLSTKAKYVEEQIGPNYFLIGPDIHKDFDDNKTFKEDPTLFKEWVEKARNEQIYFRIGRWNIPGSPIAILVDYSQYFAHKDEIFAKMWETYQLDSITGGWDYIEPALFGYAAAKVIEHFYNLYLSYYDKLVVQAHEWKAGMAILELKKTTPQAGLIFTIHNTLLGRTLANNNLPVYDKSFDIQTLISNNAFGIRSMYSLEKLAAQNADCFTVISEPNAEDAERYLQIKPCMITPNGFDCQQNEKCDNKDFHRKKIKKFVEAFFGKEISDNSLFLFTSGVLEPRTKGIDVFIDVLNQLRNYSLDKEIYAILSIPAQTIRANELVLKHLETKNYEPIEGVFSTHILANPESNYIISKLKEYGFENKINDKIKIIYIPAYLDGNDGVVNIKYYQFLSGMDLTCFASYYEAWGYTPLESIAHGVPTITTSLTGFGQWIKKNFPDTLAVKVIERNENNYSEVVEEICKHIINFINLKEEDLFEIQKQGYNIAEQSSWSKFINYYWESYHRALTKSNERADSYQHKIATIKKTQNYIEQPKWYKIFIKPYFPEVLMPLKILSENLWWSWNNEAIELFESISPELWIKSEKNPVAFIQLIDIKQLKSLEQNEQFINKLNKVYNKFKEYMSVEKPDEPLVSYFCMEYGLHSSIKLYSGGLGILAGDYLKEASDCNKNLVAVGLLYRYGYFHQKISINGEQISEKIPQKFTNLPLKAVRDENGEWVHITLSFPGRKVKAKVWLLQVGRIPLYLLDTDIEDNHEQDRSITHQLYGGDWENRFKQELLLGIGGIRMLKALNINPDLFHLNEGHAAFLNLERMRLLIQEQKLNFAQAVEVLRASSLFTTHTPVPAGHDTFDEGLLRAYLSHYPQRYNITWDEFVGLGRVNPNDHNEKFSMSVLALRLSQECNGVSRLHGKVSREMFAAMYPGYFPSEINISHVTNGIHYSTWAAPEWQNLLTQNRPDKLNEILNNPNAWQHIQEIPDKEIWALRNEFRSRLYKYLTQKIVSDYTQRQESPKSIIETIDALDDKTLTIGFARRFATYKRATLIFTNLEKLKKIVNNPQYPVRFIFAGKAHPNDKLGQELIQRIIEISKSPDFLGKIIFLENYDSEVALHLVQGVDVWLNTPTRPMEASGTSGQKCVMNGVLHFSVLDGWWAEAYVPNAGWALKEERTYTDQRLQNELDSETIYNILQEEVIPTFYNRNKDDVPVEWVKFIKNSMTKIAPYYTTRRMLNDYYEKYYLKMFNRYSSLIENNFEKARRIASWKKKVSLLWENVYVDENRCHNSTVRPLLLGENFNAEIVLNTGGLNPNEIGVEIVFGQKIMDKIEKPLFVEKLDLIDYDDKNALYRKSIEIRKPGVFDYAIRIFAYNNDLPHRNDVNFVKWG